MLLFLLLILACTLRAQSEPLQLTDSTFDSVFSIFSQSSSVLILFVAEPCRHCLEMAAEYEALSTDPALKGTAGPNVLVATVDGKSNRALKLRFGVRSYPTLIYLHNGRVYRYGGGARSHPSMRAFALKGYENQGDGEPMPAALTWTNTFGAYRRAAWGELNGAARGELGLLGYGMVLLTGFVIGLVLFSVYVALVLAARKGIGFKKDY